jgi:hypothetical protein
MLSAPAAQVILTSIPAASADDAFMHIPSQTSQREHHDSEAMSMPVLGRFSLNDSLASLPDALWVFPNSEFRGVQGFLDTWDSSPSQWNHASLSAGGFYSARFTGWVDWLGNREDTPDGSGFNER